MMQGLQNKKAMTCIILAGWGQDPNRSPTTTGHLISFEIQVALIDKKN